MPWIPVPRPLCQWLVGATFLLPLMAQGDDWTRLPPNSGQPSRRFNHTLAYDSVRNVLVLFGGKNASGNHSSRTWTRNGVLWTESLGTGTPPPQRANHSMAFDAARGQMVMFGGDLQTGNPTVYYRDTWTWDGTNWSQRSTSTLPRRTRAAMAYDALRQQVVMFGGQDETGTNLTDTLLWNGTAWTQATPVTPPPLGRRHLSLVQDSGNGRILLFGGTTDEQQGGTYTNYNDTWEWNGTGWTMRNNGLASSPSERFRVAMAFDGQRITLHGGRTGPLSYVDDTWQWDWPTSTWSLVPTLQQPSPRAGAAMAFDASSQQLILFGGYRLLSQTTAEAYDDTWEFGSNTTAAAFQFGTGCPPGATALQLTATGLPQRGTTTNVQLSSVQPNELPFFAAGFSDQYLGTTALPSPLPSLGNCDLRIAPLVAEFRQAQGSIATRPWTIPNDPSLRGTTFFLQCVTFDPSSGAIRTSNGLGLRIGN